MEKCNILKCNNIVTEEKDGGDKIEKKKEKRMKAV